MKVSDYLLSLTIILLSTFYSLSQNKILESDTIPYNIYPDVIDVKPDLPSPFILKNGNEFVVAATHEKKYAIIEVTLHNDRGIGPQLQIDTIDFPRFAHTGLHAEERLNQLDSITGRSLDEITELGRPGALSFDGFMAQDENILSVLKNDNRMVRKLGFTHPQLAKPLFHVLNMMDTDLTLHRWNMAKHQWENIHYFFYNGHQVFVEAEDTKGGQKSIFNDNIEGAFYIRLWREFDPEESQFLTDHYGHLSKKDFDNFKNRLRVMNTGEMEPQYIMRYGFYEGHTFWRTDPIVISFIFGLKSLDELDRLFEGDLHNILSAHFTE